MQWTNGNGGPYGEPPYGEDPYGGAGYAYAYGHDGYGGDTATLTWDPAPLAQGTQPHPTAWDTARGDVLTMPASETQAIPFVPEPEPEPAPKTPGHDPARPVFVDSSGRRQRHVLRAARLLLIPAGGYVALLAGTLLGGPSVSAPFVPQPDTTHGAAPGLSAPDSPSGSAHAAASHDNSRPTARQTPAPAGRRAASTAPGPAPAATSGTGTVSRTVTATPVPAHSSRGRALGASHKHVK
ncbi:hypothetical protein BFF78_12255 [Streptomyces fodineus]|uniref:Uncharacterized protein n=1 Tax=Streptomyces fodineus TaxID=1904616 RepID=A0A1D7Y837_9ACTN|nr:hypothetical protein [Streptomyces fodineus]AOR31721.1 hypothetical protein BFF78_12255 [Streptomyces fodineus]